MAYFKIVGPYDTYEEEIIGNVEAWVRAKPWGSGGFVVQVHKIERGFVNRYCWFTIPILFNEWQIIGEDAKDAVRYLDKALYLDVKGLVSPITREQGRVKLMGYGFTIQEVLRLTSWEM